MSDKTVEFCVMDCWGVFLMADKKHAVALFEYEKEAWRWAEKSYSHRDDVVVEKVLIRASRQWHREDETG